METIEHQRWQQGRDVDQQAQVADSRGYWPAAYAIVLFSIPWMLFEWAFPAAKLEAYVGGINVQLIPWYAQGLLCIAITAAHSIWLWRQNRAIWWPFTAITIALLQATTFVGLGEDGYISHLHVSASSALTFFSIAPVVAYLLGQVIAYRRVCGVSVRLPFGLKVKHSRAEGNGSRTEETDLMRTLAMDDGFWYTQPKPKSSGYLSIGLSSSALSGKVFYANGPVNPIVVRSRVVRSMLPLTEN